MTTGTRPDHDFCWINILSREPARACEFFAAILGWECVAMPGLGYGLKVGGRHIGGLFDTVSPRTPEGCPPVIGVMLKVDNVDATAERIRALGGRADPAFDIGDQGRMAVCHDPAGAQFDLWQPKKMQGTDADSTRHGAPSWFENLTTDPAGAATFYTRLFGWTAHDVSAAESKYTEFKLGSRYVAGMLGLTPAMGVVAPYWATYFTVQDADVAAKDAEALGGTICLAPRDIPGAGRMAGIVSPQGVTFFVIRYQQRP